MLIFKILFLIGGKLLYNVVLVSAIQQCESAICMHISPPIKNIFKKNSIEKLMESG